MVNVLNPFQARVRFADATSPSGQEVSVALFLREARCSAARRFLPRTPGRMTFRTFTHVVPGRTRLQGSTGTIVAHVSRAMCSAWEASRPGSPRENRAHVEEQVDLALADLAAQDFHAYLALTDAQGLVFRQDLSQMFDEALDRTSFSRLRRRAETRWEGTLVESIRPPSLVLAVSIGFHGPTAGA